MKRWILSTDKENNAREKIIESKNITTNSDLDKQDDDKVLKSLRPKKFSDYVGQKSVVEVEKLWTL